MFVILWEYRVNVRMQVEFERIYSADGAWADLFRQSAGYLGTELLQDETEPRRYLTIDRWDSREAYETFLKNRKTEYDALDARCAGLAEREFLLGKWITQPSGDIPLKLI